MKKMLKIIGIIIVTILILFFIVFYVGRFIRTSIGKNKIENFEYDIKIIGNESMRMKETCVERYSIWKEYRFIFGYIDCDSLSNYYELINIENNMAIIVSEYRYGETYHYEIENKTISNKKINKIINDFINFNEEEEKEKDKWFLLTAYDIEYNGEIKQMPYQFVYDE